MKLLDQDLERLQKLYDSIFNRLKEVDIQDDRGMQVRILERATPATPKMRTTNKH